MKRMSNFCILLIIALLTPMIQATAQTPISEASSQAARDADGIEMLISTEQRAEALRAKLFDLEMKEIELQARLEDLDVRLRPENIQRALSLVGSVRPMDELRDALRIRIENEKARVTRQLEIVGSNRERLESLVSEADAAIELLRQQ